MMLRKLSKAQYSELISIAGVHNCGCVYPLSVAEGTQTGDIYTDSDGCSEKFLFWTQSGFSYLSGVVDNDFLNDIYRLMTDRRKPDGKRFLLMTKDQNVLDYFDSKEDVIAERRYLFEYTGQPKVYNVPEGYELKETDNRSLDKISGTIVPGLFWSSADEFLAKGKGYCITCGEDIVSWAFSSAVSTDEIDIGIETNPDHKKKGLGIIVANEMIQYTLQQGKKPVWACHCKNTASEKMAEKLGFVKIGECFVLKAAN